MLIVRYYLIYCFIMIQFVFIQFLQFGLLMFCIYVLLYFIKCFNFLNYFCDKGKAGVFFKENSSVQRLVVVKGDIVGKGVVRFVVRRQVLFSVVFTVWARQWVTVKGLVIRGFFVFLGFLVRRFVDRQLATSLIVTWVGLCQRSVFLQVDMYFVEDIGGIVNTVYFSFDVCVGVFVQIVQIGDVEW